MNTSSGFGISIYLISDVPGKYNNLFDYSKEKLKLKEKMSDWEPSFAIKIRKMIAFYIIFEHLVA